MGETEAVLQKEAETEMKGGGERVLRSCFWPFFLLLQELWRHFLVSGAKHPSSKRATGLDWGLLLWLRALTDTGVNS